MTDLAPPPLLLRSVERGVLTLTLNRPQARNALSMALMGGADPGAGAMPPRIQRCASW